MTGELISLISAGVGGLVALIVLMVNQFMQHRRWKENLQRKGEDKYLEKKIDILHETNVELFKLANDALELSKIADKKDARSIASEFQVLDSNIRLVIALSSPYLGTDKKDDVEIFYELLTVIRMIYNEELAWDEEEIITHLLWINEHTWNFRDQLSNDMQSFYKDSGPNINWIPKLFPISIFLNVLFIIYILFIN